MDRLTPAEIIRTARRKQGMTAATLAAMIKRSETTISNYENGLSVPIVEVIPRLRHALKLTKAEIDVLAEAVPQTQRQSRYANDLHRQLERFKHEPVTEEDLAALTRTHGEFGPLSLEMVVNHLINRQKRRETIPE